MKNVLGCLLIVGTLLVAGCSQGNWGWENSAPIIENVASISAKVAFAQPDVQPYRATICEVSGRISVVLSDYDNPDATFETTRQMILDVVRGLDIREDIKSITVTIVDSALNTTWIFVRTYYEDFVHENEAQAAMMVAKAVAGGIDSACNEVATFSEDFELVIHDK